MLYMLWNECFPNDIYKHICQNDNFIYLNWKNVLHQKTSEIFWQFIEENTENYKNV